MSEMGGDVQAGRLHLDAYVDTAGITRGLQRRIDAETRNIRARIKAEIDSRGTVTAARKAAAEASKATKVRLKAELDTRGLIGQARSAAQRVSEQVKVTLRAEVDQRSLRDVQQQVDRSAKDTTVDVDVEADISGAEEEIEAQRQSQERRPIRIPVSVDTSKLAEAGTAMMQLSKAPMIAGGVFMLGTAVVQLGGGLVSMASAASQAVGTLAAIPNLLGVAAQGIGALVIGFSGIGEAVTSLGEVQAAATEDATVMAEAQTAAAEQVADAQRALADARHQAADSARAATEAISDAEWGLARAQESALDAQDALNDARATARERIQDLNRELEASATDELSAVNALKKAREDMQDVQWDKSSTEQERRDAQLAVEQAKDDLAEVRDRRADLTKETAAANKAGVQGSDDVVAAQRRVRDTTHAQEEAEEALAEARHSAVDTARASAQAIAAAQRAITQAQRAATDAATEQTAAQSALATAMDKLSPAGQRFARFIYSLKPRWDELKASVQSALLPPIQRGIKAALPLLDTLETGLVGSARRVGGLGERLGRLFGRDTFNDDVATIMGSNNRALGSFSGAAFNLVQILRDLAVVAGPTLVEPFAKWVKTLTAGWRESVRTGRKTGELQGFFERAADRAAQLGDIIANLGGALFGMGKAATPAGDSLLSTFEKTTAKWNEWANSDAGHDRMQEFFDATVPTTEALGDLIAQLSELLIKTGEGGGGPLTGFVTTLTTLVNGLNRLMDIPGAGPAIGALMTLAGVGGALGFVSGAVFKMGKNLGKLGKLTGLSKLIGGITGAKDAIDDELPADKAKAEAVDGIGKRAATTAKRLGKAFVGAVVSSTKALGKAAVAAGRFALQVLAMGGRAIVATARIVAHTAAMVAQRIAMVAAAAAQRTLAATQWLLNAAMNANPIGLVVLAIAALVAGVIWAYKNFSGFRKLVKRVWSAIQTGAQAVKDWLKDNWPILLAIITGPFGLAFLAIKKNWTKIKDGAKWLKDWIKKNWPILLAILTGPFGLAVLAIAKNWDKIKDKIKDTYNKYIKPVLQGFRDFIMTTIPDAFSDAVEAISSVWESLRNIAKSPVEFMVNTVYNKGIRRVVNAIPGVPDLPELEFKYARGGVLPGFTPGRDVHKFVSPTGGRLALSGGESILRPEFTRAVGPRAVDFLNSAARRGVGAVRDAMFAIGDKAHHFARGGIVYVDGEPMSRVAAAQLAVAEKASGIAHRVMQGSYQPVTSYSGTSHTGGGVMDTAPGTFTSQSWLRKVGFAAWARNIPGAGYAGSGAHVHSVSRIDPEARGHAQLSSFARGEDGLGHGDTGPNPPLVPSLIAQVRDLAGASLGQISAASTGGGGNFFTKFLSAIDSAKDFVKNIPDWFDKMREMNGWAPMLIDSVKHLGEKLRGWVNDKVPGPGPIPSIFDRGGPLYPGSTLAINTSGKTETVFTNEQITTTSASLADLARSLRSMVGDGPVDGDRLPALVENLTLQGRPEDMPNLLADANYELRKIRRGGVHAKRT